MPIVGWRGEYHPDRPASVGSAAGSDSMPTINEAYRVLDRPGPSSRLRRLVPSVGLRVDLRRATSGRSPGTGSDVHRADAPEPSRTGTDPVAQPGGRRHHRRGRCGRVGPVHRTRQPTAGPDGILGVGAVLAIEANGFAQRDSAPCDADVDLVVSAVVPFDATVPRRHDRRITPTGHRDACIVRDPDVAQRARARGAEAGCGRHSWPPAQGRLAQSEERHVHTVEVVGSRPLSPTLDALFRGVGSQFSAEYVPNGEAYSARNAKTRSPSDLRRRWPRVQPRAS